MWKFYTWIWNLKYYKQENSFNDITLTNLITSIQLTCYTQIAIKNITDNINIKYIIKNQKHCTYIKNKNWNDKKDKNLIKYVCAYVENSDIMSVMI